MSIEDEPEFPRMVDEIANALRQSYYEEETAVLSKSAEPEMWRRMAKDVLLYMEKTWE